MGKIALLFPGQGSQALGMGKDVAETSPRAAAVFARASEVLGYDLAAICFNGPAERLESTEVQQPAIFAASVAIYEAWRDCGLPDDVFEAVAGLSLGEYTALHVAGSIGFEDGLRLVQTRGRLMEQAGKLKPGGMVSLIGADAAKAERICDLARGDDVLAPANYNCPGQVVISGDAAACDRALKEAEGNGCRAVALKVSGAFHTSRMQPAAEGLSKSLAETPIMPPKVRVVANVDAQDHHDADSIRRSLQRQLTHPVLWQKSIERLIEDGFDMFVEVGPGRVLTGLMRKINRGVRAVNVSSAADLAAEPLAVLNPS